MTADEFFNQSPPLLLRSIVSDPPDDWPTKGTRQYNVNAMRLDYVRRGLVTFYDEYVASKQPGDLFVTPDAVVAARRAPLLFDDAVGNAVSEAVAPVGGVWKCGKCKAAPPRYANYPNNYKWKTEKGFLNHNCLG